MKNVIAADIGGTNSRFAFFRLDEGEGLSIVDSFRFKTGDARSLAELIEEVKKKTSVPPYSEWDALVLAVPGAVKERTFAKLANVPWTVDVSKLRLCSPEKKIFLINDFVAQAYACQRAGQLERRSIQAGVAKSESPVAVIGAGTGLGHCVLAKEGHDTFLALPSEAGHAAFPFYGKAEAAYQDYLLERTGAAYPYGDIVVSGPGLSSLHAYLTGDDLSPEDVANSIAPDSETTMYFARFYGRACRNYALTVLAVGGLYITGGVAIKNPFLVMDDHFREEFVDSAHYRTMLEEIPVMLILDEDIGLWGAANFGALNLRIGT